MKRLYLSSASILISVGLSAEIISLNFTGGRSTTSYALGSSDLAGLVGTEAGHSLGSTLVGNWNNLDGNSGSSGGSLLGSDGNVAVGVTVTWNADNTYDLPNTTGGSNTSANTTMMKGYLDNDSENTTTVTVSGLEALSGSYSVIVYVDGDNEEFWQRGDYTIGTTTVQNEDGENIDFNSGSGNNANGLFQTPVPTGSGGSNWPVSPNNSEGNMIIFSGLTSSSFTLNADPVSSSTTFARAPVNGMQIVGVVIPEPASGSLVAIFLGLALFMWTAKSRFGKRGH